MVKRLFTRMMEKITGRKCCRCRWNYNGRCYHPESSMFMRCWNSMTRPGYEDRGCSVNYSAAKSAAVDDEKTESGLLTED